MISGGYVYIMSNFSRTTLYVGVTNDLYTRILQHRNGEGSKFTSRYKCFDLIYFEDHKRIADAIAREKQLKRWHRQWKINLIKSVNPELKDLFNEI